MGHIFSLPISPMIIKYLRSLQKRGNDTVYTLKEFKTKINLNKFPGCGRAPKCRLTIKDATIRINEDLHIDGQPLTASTSKVTLFIREAVIKCDLGYCIRFTGRIILYNVLVRMQLLPRFDRGIKVANFYVETELSEIKSQSLLFINGVNHSQLANALLNIKSPFVASNVVDAVFLLLKEVIIDWMNRNIETFAKRCGLC